MSSFGASEFNEIVAIAPYHITRPISNSIRCQTWPSLAPFPLWEGCTITIRLDLPACCAMTIIQINKTKNERKNNSVIKIKTYWWPLQIDSIRFLITIFIFVYGRYCLAQREGGSPGGKSVCFYRNLFRCNWLNSFNLFSLLFVGFVEGLVPWPTKPFVLPPSLFVSPVEF